MVIFLAWPAYGCLIKSFLIEGYRSAQSGFNQLHDAIVLAHYSGNNIVYIFVMAI